MHLRQCCGLWAIPNHHYTSDHFRDYQCGSGYCIYREFWNGRGRLRICDRDRTGCFCIVVSDLYCKKISDPAAFGRRFSDFLSEHGTASGIGNSMGLQFSITAIGTIIVQGAVNIYGAVYMAGFSAAGKLQNIIVTVFTAFGATVATYVGQNRGAGKMDRVHKGVRYTQIMVFVWSAVTMVLVYFFGEEMTLLFVSKTETEVLHAAEVYFRTVFWAYPFLGSIFIYRNALQGMGYGLVPMLGGVFELAARALIVLLVAGKTSFFGVCLADPAAWISALIPLIPYYIYVMKKYEKQKQLEG